MKKLLLAFVLLLAGMNIAQAQKNYEYDVWDVMVGGKAGGSFGLLTNQPCNPLWGPFGSIEAEMYLNKKFSMSLEMSAAHKGADDLFTRESGNTHAYYQYRMDYINTSYIINYHLFRQHVSLYTGLTLGRLVNAKSMKNGQSIDIMDEVHKGDFSVPVGIEWTIGKHFTIDGRWHWSPRWVAKSQKAKNILGKSRHQFVSLTIGYKVQVF